MLDFGLGLKLLTQRSLRAQGNYRCRNAGRWPYSVPQTALRRVVKMCSYFVPRLRDFEGHAAGLAEL